MKMFVVTKGEYSAYRIVGLFSSRYKANKYIKRYHTNDNPYYEARIETWEVDALMGAVKRNLNSYLCRADKTTKELVQCELREEYIPEDDLYVGRDSDNNYYTTVLAKDTAHASKIAKDRIMQYIAEEVGV